MRLARFDSCGWYRATLYLGMVHKWRQPRGGREGVSQKLTKVDKEGGICQKLMSATYQIHMAKIMTFAPLEPFYLQKLYFFSNFLLSYWTYLLKNMFIWKKLRFSFVAHNIRLHQPVLKSWCQPGGRGVFFVKSWQKLTRGGGGVKIDQILADVICEPSLTS